MGRSIALKLVVLAVPASLGVYLTVTLLFLPVLAVPAALVSGPVEQAVVAGEIADLVPLERNIDLVFSLEHGDSKAIVTMLIGIAGASGGTLQSSGDGQSGGSVRIFAGIEGQIVHIAVVYVTGGNGVKFVVLSAPVVYSQLGGNGYQRIAPGLWYDPVSLTWTCAWTFSSMIGRDVPQQYWLNASDSWLAWERIRVRYQMVYELTSVPLPPLPF